MASFRMELTLANYSRHLFNHLAHTFSAFFGPLGIGLVRTIEWRGTISGSMHLSHIRQREAKNARGGPVPKICKRVRSYGRTGPTNEKQASLESLS